MPQVAETPKPRGFAWMAAAVREAAHKHHTPREVGAAVGAGVFIGCSPFFGFHSLIAAAVSWLLGLNFIYVWMGTHVSNPVFAADPSFLPALELFIAEEQGHSAMLGRFLDRERKLLLLNLANNVVDDLLVRLRA